MAVDRDFVPQGRGQRRDAAGQLCRELEFAGIQPLLALDSKGDLAGGVTLPADGAAVFGSDAAAARLARQVYDIASRQLPLAVAVTAGGDPGPAQGCFERVCLALRDGLRRAQAPSQAVHLSIRAQSPGPEEAHALAAARLAAAILSVHIGPSPAGGNELWECLYRGQRQGRIRVAYATGVGSACPLLASEAADVILPGVGAVVPAGTAWIAMRVCLGCFADQSGGIDSPALEKALQLCVHAGDRLHELARWPTAQMRLDAWLNRRLAIMVGGLGELLQRRRQDPRSFASLQELEQLLLWIREILQQHSQRLAADTGTLPVLGRVDPSRGLPDGPMRDSWRARWVDAVAARACRHRNLLALSPAALFPAAAPADYRYADLLPLMRHADVVSVAGLAATACWSINQFKDFHRRACAALQQREHLHQIAEPM